MRKFCLRAVVCAAVVALGSWGAFGAAVTPTDYAKKVEIALSDDAKTALGDSTLADFPLPVRLSTAIEGFSYADFQCAGEDIAFADADGNALAFELDTWDTTGTSLYWVKIPSLTKDTTLTVYYGADTATTHTPSDVWTKYVAVIHGGAEPADSSPANLAVTLNAVTGVTTNGFLGTSLNKAAYATIGLNIANPRNALTSSGAFSVSAWYRLDGNGGNSDNNFILASTRSNWSSADGFMMNQEKGKYVSVSKKSTHLWSSGSKLTVGTWGQVAFAYQSGTSVTAYLNGVQYQQSTDPGTLESTGTYWTFGSYMNTASKDSMRGDMDEIRVYDGVASSEWFAAEYGFAANAAWVSAGEAETTDAELVRFVAAPTLTSTADGLRVSVTLQEDSHAGAVYAICGAAQPYSYKSVISELAQPGETVSGLITNMPADVVCGFGVLGVSSADAAKTTTKAGDGTFCGGTISIAKGADADEEFLDVPGTFTVTRPAGATTGDLVVNYTASGTAVAGTHYQTLPGSVTIPDGETSATINVYPLAACTTDHTLTLTIANGFYATSSSSASIAIKKFDPTTGFEKKVEFTVSGYAGVTLANFPVLVKISESAIAGFKYDDCQLANGGDLRFIDESNNRLSSEVDVWDEDGDSYVWVKVPQLTSTTKITMVYGNSAPYAMTPADTWSDYAGVYHFTEADAGTQTVKDSSGNSDGTSHANSLVMDGVIGKARGRTDATGKNGATMTAPISTALDNLTPTFTVSGWVYPTTTSAAWEYIFSRKNADAYKSWGWQFRSDSNLNSVGIYSSGTADDNNNRNVFSTSGKFAANTWVKYNVVYTSTQVSLYLNGALIATQTIKPTGGAVNGSLPFAVGGLNGDGHGTMRGYFDETRLRYGSVDADWIAAEYAFEHGSVSFTNGGAVLVDETSITFAGKSVVTKESGVFKLSATTGEASGTGTITAKYGTSDAYGLSATMTSAAEASTTYKVSLSGLEADTSYKARAEGVNAKGSLSRANADETFYNGTLTIVKGVDADENELAVPATIIVSRADTYGDLVVNYTIGGTGVAGVNYVEIPNSITITNGASSATIEIYPLKDNTADHTVEITLADGLYFVNDAAKAATITIVKLHAPDGYNTWIATEDGNASVAANWSLGRVPNSTDHILVDGRFSTASMTWDAGENGLPATVAAWTQAEDYTGMVTMNTVYPGKGDFETFTVTGALTINGGTWTHPQSRTMGDNHDEDWDWLGDLKANETYRIKITCGSLAIGASGKIDVATKGYYASHNSARCFASHGGSTRLDYINSYDDPKEPIHIGLPHRTTSNYWNGKGGGAIYIVVDGAAVVNGAISADSGNTGFGAGAAGSVYLNAKSVTGIGSITARGSGSGEGNYKGTGGRIAIITDTAVNRGTFAAISAQCEWKNAQGKLATEYGGAGTVYFKDSTTANGKLVVAPKSDLSISWANRARMTYVGTEGDWTFDSIEFGYNGQLVLPVGTTLHLPNGFAGCSGTGSSVSVYGGIRYEGGTLDIGSATDQTMSGNWMIFGVSNLVLNCNLTVQEGAAIGIPAYADIFDEAASLPEYPVCRVSVIGNLDVTSNAGIYARSCGLKKYKNTLNSGAKGVLPGHSHGGRCMAYAGNAKNYQAYDSVFAPCLPGNAVPWPNGQGAEASGGVLKLTVTGTFTLDGVVNANGLLEAYEDGGSCSGGTGGSIDITAGQLKGTGSILAEGGAKQAVRGPGGRIAVKLSGENADFSDFTGKISASGRVRTGSYMDSSAGTVYLQTAAEGDKCGTVRIAMSSGNRNLNNTNTTEMVSLGYGGDAIEDYKKVNYVVSDYGRAAVNTDFQAKSVKLATTDAFIDLEGNALTVKKFMYAVADGETTSFKKLRAGTYSLDPSDGQLAFPADCPNVYDTGTGGTLTIQPDGVMFILR